MSTHTHFFALFDQSVTFYVPKLWYHQQQTNTAHSPCGWKHEGERAADVMLVGYQEKKGRSPDCLLFVIEIPLFINLLDGLNFPINMGCSHITFTFSHNNRTTTSRRGSAFNAQIYPYGRLHSCPIYVVAVVGRIDGHRRRERWRKDRTLSQAKLHSFTFNMSLWGISICPSKDALLHGFPQWNISNKMDRILGEHYTLV